MSYMRVITLGNIASDIEIKDVNGSQLSIFTLAVNHKYKNNEESSFFTVNCWRGMASTIAEYGYKGMPILLEGRMKQERWETPEGEKKSKVIMIADNFTFVGSSKKSDTLSKDQRDPQTGQHDLPF